MGDKIIMYPYIDHLFIRAYHENEPGRFATLLLRLPGKEKSNFGLGDNSSLPFSALRSIGLKCMEHLFNIIADADVSLDTHLSYLFDGAF